VLCANLSRVNKNAKNIKGKTKNSGAHITQV